MAQVVPYLITALIALIAFAIAARVAFLRNLLGVK